MAGWQVVSPPQMRQELSLQTELNLFYIGHSGASSKQLARLQPIQKYLQGVLLFWHRQSLKAMEQKQEPAQNRLSPE